MSFNGTRGNGMPSIAVVIPCHNEAQTVGAVVEDFRKNLPEAAIHVFDNCSTDRTIEIAHDAGAVIHRVPARGKGEVVRAMFRDVDADVVIMADGDRTYPAEYARLLIDPVVDGVADMVVGTRLLHSDSSGFPPFHTAGNRLILRIVNGLFDAKLSDVLSGYRAFSRRFVKTMPVLSRGFEIETEITLHALQYRIPILEVPVEYAPRPLGSKSKLHTFRDGYRVLLTILTLYKDYRPLRFFGIPGTILMLTGVLTGLVIVSEFLEFGQVVGVARAAFAVLACLLGALAITTGFVLDTVNRRARELYRLLADHLIDSGKPDTERSRPLSSLAGRALTRTGS